MKTEYFSKEDESSIRDISQQFTAMSVIEFFDFLGTLQDEAALHISIDWPGEDRAKALKAFLEQDYQGQKRTVTIRATKTEHDLAPNVFASGVKWEKVESEG